MSAPAPHVCTKGQKSDASRPGRGGPPRRIGGLYLRVQVDKIRFPDRKKIPTNPLKFNGTAGALALNDAKSPRSAPLLGPIHSPVSILQLRVQRRGMTLRLEGIKRGAPRSNNYSLMVLRILLWSTSPVRCPTGRRLHSPRIPTRCKHRSAGMAWCCSMGYVTCATGRSTS